MKILKNKIKIYIIKKIYLKNVTIMKYKLYPDSRQFQLNLNVMNFVIFFCILSLFDYLFF